MNIYSKIRFGKDILSDEDVLQIVVFEDCNLEIGVLKSFKKQFDEIFKRLYDFLYYTVIEENPCEYLKFGYDEYVDYLDLKGAYHLVSMICNKDETMIKNRLDFNLDQSQNLKVDILGKEKSKDMNGHYCDFCNSFIHPKDVTTLDDGRQMCLECRKHLIKDKRTLNRMIKEIHNNFQVFYGAKIAKNIVVKLVNAKKLHRLGNMKFDATDDYDPRTVGFARKHKTVFGNERIEIFVENGAPINNTL